MGDMTEYFSGRKLWGDDFSPEQVRNWYMDEQEGYADLVGQDQGAYGYHALNRRYGYGKLPKKRFNHVLGLGAADGQELEPILGSIGKATILEPSDAFARDKVGDVPVSYVKPAADGRLPFQDGIFDLVLSLGVLHHIARVTDALGEMYRVLESGGYALVREPTVSLGDFTRPRKGLTRRERGIPLHLFRKMVAATGFDVVSEKRCMFPVVGKLNPIIGPVYNSGLMVTVDDVFCRVFDWNKVYHPRNLLEKLRPTSVFYVLEKS